MKNKIFYAFGECQFHQLKEKDIEEKTFMRLRNHKWSHEVKIDKSTHGRVGIKITKPIFAFVERVNCQGEYFKENAFRINPNYSQDEEYSVDRGTLTQTFTTAIGYGEKNLEWVGWE